MIRSLSSNLRHTLFGVLFAGCMLFGSAQAFAIPQARVGIPVACDRYDSTAFEYCTAECVERGYDYGVCGINGYCDCRRTRPGG